MFLILWSSTSVFGNLEISANVQQIRKLEAFSILFAQISFRQLLLIWHVFFTWQHLLSFTFVRTLQQNFGQVLSQNLETLVTNCILDSDSVFAEMISITYCKDTCFQSYYLGHMHCHVFFCTWQIFLKFAKLMISKEKVVSRKFGSKFSSCISENGCEHFSKLKLGIIP